MDRENKLCILECHTRHEIVETSEKLLNLFESLSNISIAEVELETTSKVIHGNRTYFNSKVQELKNLIEYVNSRIKTL